MTKEGKFFRWLEIKEQVRKAYLDGVLKGKSLNNDEILKNMIEANEYAKAYAELKRKEGE